MLDLKLFLGFEVTPDVQLGLDKTNPYILKTFLDSQSEYLQTLHLDRKKFIGKYLHFPTDFNTLLLLEQNVVSIGKKLINPLTTQLPALQLVTVQQNE